MNLIVEREKGLLELERRIAELRAANAQPARRHVGRNRRRSSRNTQEIQREIFGSLTPWEKVHMARHPNRPTSLDYISQLDRFDELHGDRLIRDDPAIVGGFACCSGAPGHGDRRSSAAATPKKICVATSAW